MCYCAVSHLVQSSETRLSPAILASCLRTCRRFVRPTAGKTRLLTRSSQWTFVDEPQLRYLFDVIVLPINGPRRPADYLGGGNYLYISTYVRSSLFQGTTTATLWKFFGIPRLSAHFVFQILRSLPSNRSKCKSASSRTHCLSPSS